MKKPFEVRGEKEVFKGGGTKILEGKPRLELEPPRQRLEVAKVWTQGAKVHGPYNWFKGIPLSISVAAAERHIVKWKMGEDINTEDGEGHHLAHAIASLQMALESILTDGGDDDRGFVSRNS